MTVAKKALLYRQPPYMIAKDVLSLVSKLSVIQESREMEINKSLLDANYKFIPNSPLEAYIEIKRKKSKEVYTLREVIFMW